MSDAQIDGKETLVESIPHDLVDFEEDERLDALLEGIAESLEETDARIERLRDNYFTETADGDGLDRLATPFELSRLRDEDDEQLRTRLRGENGRVSSDTTVREFGAIVQHVLDADTDNFTVRAAGDREEPIVVILIDEDVLDESPLPEDEVARVLNQSTLVADRIEVDVLGTFRFDGENYEPPEDSGFGEGTFGDTLV